MYMMKIKRRFFSENETRSFVLSAIRNAID